MPSSTTLQHAIENITIWRKGEQRAPHKPLLLLYVLSQYQRGHARMFDYASEIRDELHNLLERFGPQRRQYRPDMPFWRLKGDGFWELHNSEQCSTQGSRQPPGKELELCHVAGGFDEPHFALLNRNKKLINTLAHQILEAHFTESIQEDLAEEMGFDLLQIRKERDPHFRHKAFDKGSIGLDEDMRIQVSPAVNGGGIVGRLFWDFDGKPITLPQGKACHPQEGFVAWHRREVFRG